MRRLRWALVAAGVLGLVGVVIAVRRRVPPPVVALNGKRAPERRARSHPEALQVLADGPVSRFGLDLDRLKELEGANHKPLMEYLGYIQVQRGGNESLLFVRQRDLDELARLVGQTREDFVKQFKRLGILLSMN